MIQCRPARSYIPRVDVVFTLFRLWCVEFQGRPPALPTARCRSLRGLGLRGSCPGISIASLRRRTRPPGLVSGLRFAGSRSLGLNDGRQACLSPPARSAFASLPLPSRSTGRPAPSEDPEHRMMAEGPHPKDCLSLGRGGARAKGRGEKGILAYPLARHESGGVGEN